jgi:hypothetical protein
LNFPTSQCFEGSAVHCPSHACAAVPQTDGQTDSQEGVLPFLTDGRTDRQMDRQITRARSAVPPQHGCLASQNALRSLSRV